MTINTGNYSSVKPSVSITIHDVDVSKIDSNHSILSEIVDNLFTMESVKLIDVDGDIKDRGVQEYSEIISSRLNDIVEDTKELLDRFEIK